MSEKHDRQLASVLRRMARSVAEALRMIEAPRSCKACGFRPRAHTYPLCPHCLQHAADCVEIVAIMETAHERLRGKKGDGGCK